MSDDAKKGPPQKFLDACKALDISLGGNQLELLRQYLERLLEANKTTNLTAIRDIHEAWSRHVLESLALQRYLVGVDRLIDIGSGGGLPGIPLAIACKRIQVTLVEATGKKAGFLQGCVETLDIHNACVVAERAESLAHKALHREQYDLATIRAVGSLREVLELTIPFLHVAGRVLAMKGRAAFDEIEESETAFRELDAQIIGIHPMMPEIEPGLHVVEIRKLSATDQKYPRKPGIPKKRPL